MRPEQQQIAIAKACGIRAEQVTYTGASGERVHTWVSAGRRPVPDYLNDLNACHEMEKILTDRIGYLQQLGLGRTVTWNLVNATAAQKCEAFLKTLNRWTDNE